MVQSLRQGLSLVIVFSLQGEQLFLVFMSESEYMLLVFLNSQNIVFSAFFHFAANNGIPFSAMCAHHSIVYIPCPLWTCLSMGS